MPPVSVAVISGNPRPASRTLTVARTLAGRLAEPGASVVEVEPASFADQLFSTEAPAVEEAVRTVRSARLVLLATPVYKASYTGLLKAFLDRLPPAGLASAVAVPVVVAASEAHRAVCDVHLRPVLLELGAVVPVPALALTEAELVDLDAAVAAWVDLHGNTVRAAARPPAAASVSALRGSTGPAPAATEVPTR